MNDSYSYSRHVSKRIFFYLMRQSRSLFTYEDCFIPKVSDWIRTFQVAYKFRRQTFWDVFIAFYGRQMSQYEETLMIQLYPDVRSFEEVKKELEEIRHELY